MGTLLPHIPPDTPAEPLAKAVDLSDEGKKLLRDGDTAEVFLQTLIDADEILDAIRLVAGALHPQLAVSWALDCASKSPPEDDDKKNKMAGDLLDMAQQWLDEPGDTPLRREAMVAAEESGYFGPAAWVAAAIGWSGGSIAPITAPPLDPPVGLCARAASGAINISACRVPDEIMQRANEFLELGLEYAQAAPPKGTGPTATIAPKPAPAPARAEPAADDTDKASEEEERPVARSLRRSPGAPTAGDTPKAPPPPPEPSPRSLRRKSPGQSGSSGSGWGSSGDSDSGGGWNPKPL